MTTPAPTAHTNPINGTCCFCGKRGHFDDPETPCAKSPDESHCEHWWDGPDEEDPE